MGFNMGSVKANKANRRRAVCCALGALLLSSASPRAVSVDDRAFLSTLMTDTWRCLEAMIEPGTGFPQDTQRPGGVTNTTNIGLYLAALCAAKEAGLITTEHGRLRAAKIVSSLERCKRMHGFMPNFIPVDLKGQKLEGHMAVSDFNKLAVGLIMARHTWPDLSARISDFLDRIEWKRLYHPENGTLSWGYNFDNDAPTGGGNLWLTADTRSAVFMMVATDAAPPEVWARMERHALCTPYGTICRGYGLGGLFLHAMDGLFLPETDTEVGESAGNLAWQQIQFAQKRGYPFWGWSNCYMPGRGYTEGGYLSEHVVTPHAVALMLDYYPRHATVTLREMVARGGTVPPAGYEGKSWGLRDSYDMKAEQWDERYLSLDQGMLFLAVANYLYDGMVRRIYASDPVVRNGLAKLTPYMTHDPDLLQTWKKRDAVDLTEMKATEASGSGAISLTLTSENHTGSNAITVKPEQGSRFSIDVNAENNAEPILARFSCAPVSLAGLRSLDVDLKLTAPQNTPCGYLRIVVIDRFGQERCAYIKLNGDMTTYRINADELLGIHLDETAITGIQFVAWTNPWFYTDRKLMTDRLSLELGDIRISSLRRNSAP